VPIETPQPPQHPVHQRPPAPEPPQDARSVSLATFRTGWEALHEGRNTDAIAAFDRATDPVVAEDAAFWAAVATERAGDAEAAARRYRAFLDRFPQSPHADTARSALHP
jgi:TolA-binding protein